MERQSRGQAVTDLHTPRGQKTQRPPTLTSIIGTLDLAITEEHHPGIYICYALHEEHKEGGAHGQTQGGRGEVRGDGGCPDGGER